MNKDKYPMYALVAVAAAAIAVWAGLPVTFLLLLICPAMMLFMMRGMGSSNQTHDQDAVKRSDASKLDGSHERIDQP